MVQQIEESLAFEFQEELNKVKVFDVSKLKLTSEDNKVLDKFFKKFLDPKENFPEGARHSIIEKNFAIYVVKNKIPIEQLQEAYKSKGFNIQSLKSQINGVLNGTYSEEPNVSIGELVNWCKEFRPDLANMFNDYCVIGKPEMLKQSSSEVIKKSVNPFKKLHYSVEHLPMFHEFDNLIGLYGRHYIPIKKARWYQLMGGILQTKIKLGGLSTDSRLNVAYPLPTEAGKNEIIYSVKELVDKGISKGNEKYTISEPLSYSPESLVGKFVERLVDNPAGKPKKIKEKIENRGHFNSDFLEFDECTQLITGTKPEDSQAREYISKSENEIGRNKVEKRLVDDLITEMIAYCPKNTDSFYFQPFKKIPEEAMLQGFLRRKIIPVGNVENFLVSASDSLYQNKLEEKNFSKDVYSDKIIDFLENVILLQKDKAFFFDDEAKELIHRYALYLSSQASLHSEKIHNFSRLTKYSSLSNLVKLSVILTAAHGKNIVTSEAVSLAYMDLVEFMQNTFDFIYKRVLGEFDYGTKWEGANYKQIECLKYLYENKALSFESSGITIENFISDVVMPIFKIREAQGGNKYREMVKSGLIESKQHGKNSSRVWLKFNPKLNQKMIEGDKGCKGYVTYNSIFEGIKDLVSSLKPLKPLKPLGDSDNKNATND